MVKFKLAESLNPKLFNAYKKNFLMEIFSTSDVYENILDVNRLKCEPKVVWAVDFAKQVSNIQEVRDNGELKLNQALMLYSRERQQCWCMKI